MHTGTVDAATLRSALLTSAMLGSGGVGCEGSHCNPCVFWPQGTICARSVPPASRQQFADVNRLVTACTGPSPCCKLPCAWNGVACGKRQSWSLGELWATRNGSEDF